MIKSQRKTVGEDRGKNYEIFRKNEQDCLSKFLPINNYFKINRLYFQSKIVEWLHRLKMCSDMLPTRHSLL